MVTGRPTILTEELKEQARGYVEEEGSYMSSLLPSIEGLALRLGIHRDTLYAWEKEDEDFSDILERLRQSQAKKLMDKGLAGQYNSTIAKLLLSKHGYVEKSEQDITTGGDKIQSAPSPELATEFAAFMKSRK